MAIKKGLPAFNLKNANVVILGTFPGELSLCKQEYYANSGNQFWALLGIKENDYKVKTKALKEKGIGLWDVIASCERDGSLDKNIKNEKYNNLSELRGKMVLFNGAKAYKYYSKAVKVCGYEPFAEDKIFVLPSSSPACSVAKKDKQKQRNSKNQSVSEMAYFMTNCKAKVRFK